MKNSNFYRACLPGLSTIILLASCNREIKNEDPARQLTVTATSVVEWTGYLKDGSSNSGTIRVRGTLTTDQAGEVKQGEFYMPLSSMQNQNLPTSELRNQLVHHLQSPDFFHMAIYPEVHFLITEVSPGTGRGIYRVKGDLTFLGKTHPVVFQAEINGTDSLTIEGDAIIDRTKWGMTYASDEAVENGMYIRPGIDLHLKIRAVKALQNTESNR